MAVVSRFFDKSHGYNSNHGLCAVKSCAAWHLLISYELTVTYKLCILMLESMQENNISYDTAYTPRSTRNKQL